MRICSKKWSARAAQCYSEKTRVMSVKPVMHSVDVATMECSFSATTHSI